MRNGRKADAATPRGGRRPSGRKPLSVGKKKVTVPTEEAPANYVPAAAVRRRGQALFGITGRKELVGWKLSLAIKSAAQLRKIVRYCFS